MNYNTIAETQNYIVLENYTKLSKVSEAPATYQSENALEREFIEDFSRTRLWIPAAAYYPRSSLGKCAHAAAKP